VGAWPAYRNEYRWIYSCTAGDRNCAHFNQDYSEKKLTGVYRMDLYKRVSFCVITLGICGLAYCGFSYTTETYAMLSGPLHWPVHNNEFMNKPAWASLAVLLIGSVLLLREKNPASAALRYLCF
jgi:hypothetical protein